jgi:hypothetical protein
VQAPGSPVPSYPPGHGPWQRSEEWARGRGADKCSSQVAKCLAVNRVRMSVAWPAPNRVGYRSRVLERWGTPTCNALVHHAMH